METVISVLQALSGIAFLSYGIACFSFHAMEAEFKRYNLVSYRRWIGLLEILGGLGLWIGFFFPVLTLVAAGGLTALMLLGVMVRLRLRDDWIQMLPAVVLGGVNGWIFFYWLAKFV